MTYRQGFKKEEAAGLNFPRPKGWRMGQMIENLKRWIFHQKGSGDLFCLSDEEFIKLYQEYLKTMK